ncbi:single-stranded DNA-binding protein [Paramicrobacterium chengjingii]|uniref:single-stranded DNA-binding protein n=1 Tax=Paramicrobacterium chengjingii TaxID=2769067 RepID=UPI0014240112|nr:single-stranded DNA-binding protein [Microbacterium chengjingii]
MPPRTQQSLSGFIASEPALSFTRAGDARFYARIGQENYQRENDGSFTNVNTLVQYRRAAEESYSKFQMSDWFLAERYVKTYTDADGIKRSEFVAKKLGHDAARTDYAVVRDRNGGTS